MSNNSDNNMKNNNLHYRYVIFILVLALISTFSYYFYGNEDLVKTISFAGTLASIILSVLAIFITVLSNDSLSSMIHKIRDLYEVIKDIPDSIKKSIISLGETTRQLQNNIEVMNGLLPELKTQLCNVDEHIRESNEVLRSFASQQNLSSEKVIKEDVTSINLEAYFKQFLEGSSFVGLCLLYLLFTASKSNKMVSLAEYCEKVDLNSTLQYDFGFYIACRAAGLLFARLDGDDKYIISDIIFTDKMKKEDIVTAMKQSAASLNSPLCKAEDYIMKIDKFVNYECK